VSSEARTGGPAPTNVGTHSSEYAVRLTDLQSVWWKRLLPVQLPFHRALRNLELGRTIEIGCGAGRLLSALPAGSVGVDHNPGLVEHCRSKGLTAYSVEEFAATATERSFDSILIAHVIEHLDQGDGSALVRTYLPYLRPGGRVVVITPQERGQASDPTHVRLVDFAAARALVEACGLSVERQRSFPFPRFMGRAFIYNEFMTVARLPG
jgi:2-polyprenyl-3-methyl-5-hydroxy-6-metoxy-1,4-benzoquinol methylase